MNLERVEKVLPRLRYGITASKIISWLNNFDEKDRVHVFNMLRVYEFISYNEMLFRYQLLFSELLSSVNIGEGKTILIIPYGEFGKSATMVTYPLKNTDAFKNNKGKFRFEIDYRNINDEDLRKIDAVIFLDDFIGSGNTFCGIYGKEDSVKNWIVKHNIPKVFLLTCIIMKEGKTKIEKLYPEVEIYGDTRHKIFDKINSPLSVIDNIEVFQQVLKKYPQGSYTHGYEDSQSLISFFYGTPNNTLGIFWKSNSSLFPRHTKQKIHEIRLLRKEISFYEVLIDPKHWNINLEIISDFNDVKLDNYLLLAFLLLKDKQHSDLLISHLLSISMVEIGPLIEYFTEKDFYSNDSLTAVGSEFVSNLYKSMQKINFRKATPDNLKYQENLLYLPNQLNGKM